MSVYERLDTEYLTVRNPLYALYDNAVTTGPSDDTHDIGYYGSYWNGAATIYTGLFRDATNGIYRLYDGLQVTPDVYNGLVNTAGLGFAAASLETMNLITQGYVQCLSTTNSTSASTGSITTLGGLGVALNSYLGGLLDVTSTIKSNSTINSSSVSTGSITTLGGLGVALNTYLGGLLDVASTIKSNSTVNSSSATSGSITTLGGLGVSLDTYIGGKLNVLSSADISGSSVSLNVPTVLIKDNIIPNNTISSIIKEDNGWVGQRKKDLIAAHDTPKVGAVALNTSYTAFNNTIIIDATAIGSGYYVGWVLRDDSNTEYSIITSDTDNGGNHTFILDTPFSNNGTIGVNTYSLFNKRFSGWVWDESLTEISAYGFPREDQLNILDPSATDGSAPEYIDVSVNNLNVNGSLTVTGGISASPNPIPTMTLTTTHTITSTEITNHAIIYANPSSNITITLPALSSLTLSNYAYRITIVNVSAFRVTIAGNGADQIESRASYVLRNTWDKQTLVTTPFSTNWYIQ